MLKDEFYHEARQEGTGPLEGLRILEATNAVAGPIAGMVLVDMGAESIKVEMPGEGDMLRYIPPFMAGEQEAERSTYYLSVNRNKKCITLNLKESEGQELFRALAKHVDAVIENYKPGTMDKWGIGYEDLKKIKADIVYTSISGYGQFGPYSDRPGYDPVGQAMGGLMHVTGYPDGPPLRTGNALCDNISGWMGAMGTLAALRYRDRTGKGQHVDIGMVDTILYTSDMGIMGEANADFHIKRMGSAHPSCAPLDTYLCKDGGYIIMEVVLDAHWARLCKIMGREDLIADPRTNTMALRSENRHIVDEAVKTWAKTVTVDEAVRTMSDAQLVVAPILDFAQIIQNEHIRHRDMIAEVEHPVQGRLKLQGVAPKFSVSRCRVRRPAPILGQHNQEVYGGILGLGQQKISQLQKKGII